jgi:hypothetical protein
MIVIKSFDEIPYPIGLVKEIAVIKFEEDVENNLKLHEAIVMCDIIRGLAEASDHYVLMPKSVKYFEAIKKYNIETVNVDLEEFKLRKQNRIDRHRKGFIDTRLGDMENWYCGEAMARIFKCEGN